MLRHILDYVKTDAYLIIGTVCPAFRHIYTPSEKVTRTSKFTQSPQLLERAQALGIRFSSPCLLEDLVSRNEIDTIPLLLSRGLEWDPFCVVRAAELNSHRFFRWLNGTDLAWLPENAHCSAAESGNLSLMVYLVESRAGYPDNRALAAADRNNFSNIVGWLREIQLDSVYAMVQAAREDNVYAFEQTESFDDHHLNQRFVKEACAYGSFGVLEFFRCFVDIGPTVRDVLVAGHFFNQLEVVDWFYEFFPDLAESLPHTRLQY